MPNSLLIATPDEKWGNDTRWTLTNTGFPCEVVTNGKDCQIRLSKKKFFVAVIDLELKDHTAYEVLKFLKLSCPSIKIILLMRNRSAADPDLARISTLKKVGITEIVYGLPNVEKILKCLASIRKFEGWKFIEKNEGPQKEVVEKGREQDFIKISLDDFYSGNVVVMDHYVKQGNNSYKKILFKGQVFDPAKLKKYEAEGVTHLYLKTKDRMNYINFINHVISNMLQKSVVPIRKNLLNSIQDITIKYMEEIHTTGLNPDIVREGKEICKNMYDFIKKDKIIATSFNELHYQDPTILNHSFLVTFFSIYICKHINWAGLKTIDTIAMGALLHDIGKINLPKTIRDKNVTELSPHQLIIYQSHPKLGVDLLRKSSFIDNRILQIVNEHHECIDGSGYPNQISGIKIYPLAKIVCLADSYSDFLVNLRMPPKESLKEFLKNKDVLKHFDPLLLKALVKGIAGEYETKEA